MNVNDIDVMFQFVKCPFLNWLGLSFNGPIIKTEPFSWNKNNKALFSGKTRAEEKAISALKRDLDNNMHEKVIYKGGNLSINAVEYFLW